MKNKDGIHDWSIYKITTPTGRVYIGKTKNFVKRMDVYRCNKTKGQTMIYNSIRKYGLSAHKVEVIDSFRSCKKYADGKEIFHIRSQMSRRNKWESLYDYNNGINLTDGGDGALGTKRSAESVQKQINTMRDRGVLGSKKGRKLRPETIEKHRKNMIGNKINLGRKLSEERKRQISIQQKGRTNPTVWKKVNMYDLNGVFLQQFESVKDALKGSGMSCSGFRKLISGITVKPKKFIFKFV